MRGQSFFTTLREASFRNVPFEVDNADESGGRRLARHEYPLRDTPYAEDMGRKAGEWSIEAFIVQGRKYDYAAARDALRAALNAYGAGTLIHPTLGELTVSVDSFRLKESTREGGYCTFSITFVESGQMEKPSASSDTAHGVRGAGASARTTSMQHFNRLYAPLPQEIPQCLAALEEGMMLAMDYLSMPFALIGEGMLYAQSCIALPYALAGAIFDIFTGLLYVSDPWDVYGDSAYSQNSMSNSAYGPYGSYTNGSANPVPHRNPEALQNLLYINPVTSISPVNALRQHIAGAVTLEDALATTQYNFGTGNDALTTRDTVLTGLDTMAPHVSDTVFMAMSDVRLHVARDLTTRGGQLPKVRTVVLPATVPALVAAYALHGDAARAGEIVRRNSIRHPGQVPGNTPLEVLQS